MTGGLLNPESCALEADIVPGSLESELLVVEQNNLELNPLDDPEGYGSPDFESDTDFPSGDIEEPG